jgi:hypothetical protein
VSVSSPYILFIIKLNIDENNNSNNADNKLNLFVGSSIISFQSLSEAWNTAANAATHD